MKAVMTISVMLTKMTCLRVGSMGNHLTLTCPNCSYCDGIWSDEQDEDVPREEVMLQFDNVKTNNCEYGLHGCPKCNTVFFA